MFWGNREVSTVIRLAPNTTRAYIIYSDHSRVYSMWKCYICKVGYLTPCDSFTSYHTTQIFKISKQLSCQSIGLIYLAECITCESSCVGYSIGNLPKRFSNHKSHMKRGVKSCRLTNHFLEKDHELVRDKSQKEFDASKFRIFVR